jgi:hypothetical protein
MTDARLFLLPPRSRGSWRLLPTLLALGCGPGGASPIPQPPILAVPIDRLESTPPDPNAHLLPSFGGPPGSVPAGVTVQLTNLDDAEPPTQAIARADGSFTLPAPVDAGDELRFELLQEDGRRSPPADGVVRPDYTLQASTRLDCLQLNPGLSLLGMPNATTTLNIQNDCDETVTLSGPRFRLLPSDFELTSTLPLELPAGRQGSLAVSVPGGATRENVLFVDVSRAGTTLRYPITLVSR